MSVESTERRLRKDSRSRFETGEEIAAWCRVWVSRDRPLHLMLASRHRDFAVVTDRRLLLFSAGFFTRRPRRRVLADRLDGITVTPAGRRPGRCLKVEASGHDALLIELSGSDRSLRFADALLRGTSHATPIAPPDAAAAPVSAPIDDTTAAPDGEATEAAT